MAINEASPETLAHDDHAHDDHGHGHDHPSWLAHHFDTPEQQFDSGKLGIWLFLVTEVLFFSGMFCAYAIFRSLRPDVFEGCSQFLNTKLGAINTGVLLFSSLTMAWAVRCSQTENHKGLTAMLSATLSCAMIFLGVKAIEYSHKWSMGLLPAGLYTYDPANPHPADVPNFLAYICAPFALLLAGSLVYLVAAFIVNNKFHVAVAKPLTVVCLSFFLGVGLGMILESGGSEGHEGGHAQAVHDGEHQPHDGQHEGGKHEGEKHAAKAKDHHDEPAATLEATEASLALSVRERLATDQTNSGLQSEVAARQRQSAVSGSSIVFDKKDISGAIDHVEENVLTPSKAGVFFGIYYCMTGVHAIHILGGIGVLVWLLVRSVRQDFNRQYFGPVDYVGLYWHLVDLIWIYLFPLMYLIR
ncbi:MAG: cytochrome c oxidase subunit 3 [Pirellulales bacterium]|nr:cytochrome c oxidase subunit 3 [Pirellulales bacterium]